MKIQCPTCGEKFQPRNFLRHRKACLKRQREKAQKYDDQFRKENLK